MRHTTDGFGPTQDLPVAFTAALEGGVTLVPDGTTVDRGMSRFCPTCRATQAWPRSARNSAASKPLSAPSVSRRVDLVKGLVQRREAEVGPHRVGYALGRNLAREPVHHVSRSTQPLRIGGSVMLADQM